MTERVSDPTRNDERPISSEERAAWHSDVHAYAAHLLYGGGSVMTIGKLRKLVRSYARDHECGGENATPNEPARNLVSQTTVTLDVRGELAMLRDVVIRAHDLAGGRWTQSSEERLRRIARLTDAAIEASPAMSGFLGRGGAEAHRDVLVGSGEIA